MNIIKHIRFWWRPIHRHEQAMFIPLLIILFLLSFNQSILWNMKDALVVTSLGAEVIPFIKVWAILPVAILFTWLFTKLSNAYRQEVVFYLLTGSLLLFYALFVFVLFPLRHQLELTESAGWLSSTLPTSFNGFIMMYHHWLFTLFYVACELWTTIIVSLLFWRLANDTAKLAHAPRLYGMLTLVFNLGMVMAGVMITLFSNYYPTVELSAATSELLWEQTMMVMTAIVLANGLVIMSAFRWLHVRGLKSVDTPSPSAPKLSLQQCLAHVTQSRYLLCVAIIVVAYNVVINLVEVVWKDQIRVLYPTALDYYGYISLLQTLQGGLAIALSLSVAPLIHRFGWARAALATPLVISLLCMAFFAVLLLPHDVTAFLGINPLTLAAFFGFLQIGISKACKYSLFDSTKEMALIPLSSDSKLQGKTVIDGIGVRMGKSGASLLLQGLVITFSSIAASVPYVTALIMVAVVLWVVSIRYLSSSGLLMSISH